MKVKVSKLLTKGKTLFLAYDQGIEHGPIDFNSKNVDPLYIIDIAKKGKFNALVFHKGIAEKYKKEIKASKVPLILKLNGKTKLTKGEPVSEQLCTVKEAIKLGASAVGYTIYAGSEYESHMLHEFGEIQREAHKAGLPVVAWIYPRGKGVKGKSKAKLMAYAARLGLEIGADILKIQYNGNPKDLVWAIKSAGRAKVVISGGTKINKTKFLKDLNDIMKCGAIGLAVGRNVWQDKDPLALAKDMRKVVWK